MVIEQDIFVKGVKRCKTHEPIPALKEFPIWYNLNLSLQKNVEHPFQSQVTLGYRILLLMASTSPKSCDRKGHSNYMGTFFF